jgi:SAM-dependent methyltransferase
MDVVELREFYQQPLGLAARRLITRKLKSFWTPSSGQTVLGLGYAVPYLEEAVTEEAHRLAFMLARLGVLHWPSQEKVASALVDEFDLPLLESVVDHVLITHGLELSDNPLEMLQEVWRVMAPQGKLILVVPNRRGLWSASDASPFGHGQPFSRHQLSNLLKEARFSPVLWHQALILPPVNKPAMISSTQGLERLSGMLGRFSGVTIVEAMKQVYAFSSGKRARRLMPRLGPVLLPQPRPANSAPLQTNGVPKLGPLD